MSAFPGRAELLPDTGPAAARCTFIYCCFAKKPLSSCLLQQPLGGMRAPGVTRFPLRPSAVWGPQVAPLIGAGRGLDDNGNVSRSLCLPAMPH